jgi:hypothetical protein
MTSSRCPLLFAIVLTASVASAAPLAPTKPSQLVTLVNLVATCNAGNGRVLSHMVQGDGSVDSLVIPPGSVLVVTDWEWCESANPSAAFINLTIDGPSGLVPISTLFRAPLTAICSRADLSHGVRVPSGSQLCVTPVPASAFLRAHGYLTKDK